MIELYRDATFFSGSGRAAAKHRSDRIGHADYVALSQFRHALRQFLAFSEAAARRTGLTAQQHQALLAIKAHRPAGGMTVGELAAQLLLKPHSAAGLVERLAGADLVCRHVPARDRRCVQLRLTPRAKNLLSRLSRAHLRELRQLGPQLASLLGRLTTRGRA